mmetsp:Transcript_51687/g.83859  ORF Transcript_51687/g.83859 Transcript_51687/m.83859 type:complete len:394 (+) Transcript_51687:388-1569(+)
MMTQMCCSGLPVPLRSLPHLPLTSWLCALALQGLRPTGKTRLMKQMCCSILPVPFRRLPHLLSSWLCALALQVLRPRVRVRLRRLPTSLLVMPGRRLTGSLQLPRSRTHAMPVRGSRGPSYWHGARRGPFRAMSLLACRQPQRKAQPMVRHAPVRWTAAAEVSACPEAASATRASSARAARVFAARMTAAETATATRVSASATAITAEQTAPPRRLRLLRSRRCSAQASRQRRLRNSRRSSSRRSRPALWAALAEAPAAPASVPATNPGLAVPVRMLLWWPSPRTLLWWPSWPVCQMRSAPAMVSASWGGASATRASAARPASRGRGQCSCSSRTSSSSSAPGPAPVQLQLQCRMPHRTRTRRTRQLHQLRSLLPGWLQLPAAKHQRKRSKSR